MRRASRAALAAVALLAVPAGGCGAQRPATPMPQDTLPSTAPSTAPSAVPSQVATAAAPVTKRWVDLQAGDCLAAPPSSDPAEVMVSVVDCASAHRAETFLRADIPVNAALDDVASQRCDAGLAQYIGRSPGGAFAITYLIDSVQDRTSNNPYPSTVICLLQDPAGAPLTGSARG